MFTQKKNLLIKKKKIFKKKRKTDQKNRRYFEKISGQPIEKCGATLWLIIMFQFILMIYTRFYYVLCLQLLMNFSPLCFRFVRHFVQEHLTDISLSVCVCVCCRWRRKKNEKVEWNEQILSSLQFGRDLFSDAFYVLQLFIQRKSYFATRIKCH